MPQWNSVTATSTSSREALRGTPGHQQGVQQGMVTMATLDL
jgi:hypothetical protein